MFVSLTKPCRIRAVNTEIALVPEGMSNLQAFQKVPEEIIIKYKVKVLLQGWTNYI
jgi:hypothetical protein